MSLVTISLILAAIYCGGMWLFYFMQFAVGRLPASNELELHTFHLGLCFILAVGFLGVIHGG